MPGNSNTEYFKKIVKSVNYKIMSMQNYSLDNNSKIVIITGANGNLGTVTTKRFLDEGYFVIGVDGRSDNLTFALGNTKFEFVSVNLVNEKEAIAFIGDAIAKHGKIDAAIMLVGGFAMGDIEKTTGEDIQRMFSLNFETAYHLTRPLLPHMQQKGHRRLVFIGARPALKPEQGKGLVAYALTKSLLFTLADFINAETTGTNVVASVVVPSTIDTAINRAGTPGANPDNWVKPEQLTDIFGFICNDKGFAVREAVYKVYNNA